MINSSIGIGEQTVGVVFNAKEEENGQTTLTKYLQYNLLFTMLTISSLLTSIFALSWYGVSSKIK